MRLPFFLRCFPDRRDDSDVAIQGSTARRAGVLSVEYRLLDPAETVQIQRASAAPTRKEGLWKETCFELFLAGKGLRGYWEVNLATTGDWNVYRFSSYRRGMREEQAIQSLPFSSLPAAGVFGLSIDIDIADIIPDDRPLRIGVSAVTKGSSGFLGYWALVHPAARPDFHRRSGFILDMPAVAVTGEGGGDG